MKRILYICNTDPACVRGGAEQRTHHLYEALKTLGEVTVFCTNGAHEMVEDLWHIEKESDRIPFWKRCVNAALRGLVKGFSPTCLNFWYFPRPVPQSLEGRTFDAVVVRYLYDVAEYHFWRFGPLYVDIDDHPLQVFDTVDVQTIARWRRPLARWVSSRFVDFLTARTRGVWLSNGDQCDWVRNARAAYLPNLAIEPPAGYRSERRERGTYLMTVGVMSYAPNAEGVSRFLETVWPKLRAAYPTLEYWVGGRELAADLAAKWAAIPGVRYLGFVEDLAALYEGSLASVVPVESGGGTCIKTIESLAYSRVCLATPFGARGIPEKDCAAGANGLFIYRTPEEVIAVVTQMWNAARRRKLEYAAKAYAESRFSSEAFRQAVAALASDIDEMRVGSLAFIFGK